MASVKLHHIYKVYGNGVRAVNDFNIDIDDKEFIVFVGPSGCGKSTTLRMIAGLEEITSGELYIGDKLVNDIDPKDRDIAMVFQNYALYPHMTVYDNMAFGLVNQKTPKDEIDRRVKEAARILDLTDYLERKPKEMSGGQMQRVALGRAIVRQSKVFLLDEPLSNLDAKLRASMRTEISRLHKELQTTFIYVTHDQVEAMTMGTRIVVMKKGVVQQIDTPIQLYTHPINKFVAGFIGTPQMNFLDARLYREGKNLKITFDESLSIVKPINEYEKINSNYLEGKQEVTIGIRPDHIVLAKEKTPLFVTIELIEQLGNELVISAILNDNKATRLTLKADPKSTIKIGDKVYIDFKPGELHFFDKESEMSIFNEIPDSNYFDAELSATKIKLLGQEVLLPPFLQNKFNGKCNIEIPLDALVEGKDLKLNFTGEEDVKNKKLYHYTADDKFIFSFIKGNTLAIDFAKVTIKINDEIVFDKIDLSSRVKIKLKGMTVMGKVQSSKYQYVRDPQTNKATREEIITEKDKKVFVLAYKLNDKTFNFTNDESERIINLYGHKATKLDFDLYVDNQAIIKEDNTFTFNIIENIDLGLRKFAKIDFFGNNLIVEGDYNNTVSFGIDNSKCGLYEADSDLKII